MTDTAVTRGSRDGVAVIAQSVVLIPDALITFAVRA